MRRFGLSLVILAIWYVAGGPLDAPQVYAMTNSSVDTEHEAGKDDVIHGTINVVLANGHGIVALTDSMATATGPSGAEMQLTKPMQKLFVIDDQTVCTIAGFASQAGEPFAGATTDISGIIREFQEQLRTQPIKDFELKFRSLAMLVHFHLSLLATSTSIREGSNFPPARVYSFELTMAGYDSKGPRVGQFTLNATRQTSASGVRYYDVTFTSGMIETVGTELLARIGGQRQTAVFILTSMVPAHDPAIARYQEAKAADGGASLSLEDLKSLEIVLAAKTAARSPSVGGDNQIAVIQPNTPIELFQRRFDDTPRNVTHVGLAVNVSLRGCGHCIGGATPMMFVAGYFEGVEQDLVHDYYVGNKFVACKLTYSGGRLSGFDRTNEVIDSELILRPGWSLYPDIIEIITRYHWTEIIYDSSGLIR